MSQIYTIISSSRDSVIGHGIGSFFVNKILIGLEIHRVLPWFWSFIQQKYFFCLYIIQAVATWVGFLSFKIQCQCQDERGFYWAHAQL